MKNRVVVSGSYVVCVTERSVVRVRRFETLNVALIFARQECERIGVAEPKLSADIGIHKKPPPSRRITDSHA